MGRRSFTAEQIIGYLRQAEIMVSEGKTVREAIRQIGVTELACPHGWYQPRS